MVDQQSAKRIYSSPVFGALVILISLGITSGTARAKPQNSSQDAVLTLDEALQIALINNLALKSQRLDLDNASAQIKEGWSELFPQIDLSSSYTRNIRTVNPFAGSQAGNFFQTLGFIDWLAFNEQARTDTDPDTVPIPANEFFLRQEAGLEAAGIRIETSDNPFEIPNMYRTGVAVSQTIFDGRVLFGAKGAAKWLKPFMEKGVDRQEQLLIEDVKNSFYRSLLAQELVHVAELSVQRADRTREEMARQVAVGTTPKFQRLSAEVELANVETQLVQANNASAASLDELKLLIGMPVEQTLRLRGDLEAEVSESFQPFSVEEAIVAALQSRPDLEQASIAIELERIQLQVTRAEFLPDVSAFLNLNYIGNVPDNRTSIIADSDDPFTFSSSENGYFSSSYWDWDLNAGFNLSWNLFNGFATKQRIQQRKIALQQASFDHEYLMRSVRVEVEGVIRDLGAAQVRLIAQDQNVDRAELNYSFVETRLREGVASPIELREASDQLDQSRLNYLQAVHDFLVARSAYETAIGTSLL